MKQRENWLAISCFASKRNWNAYLQDGIYPLVKTLLADHRIATFRLQFNYLSGENIRLALQVANIDTAMVAEWTDHRLKLFMKTKGFIPIEKHGDFNRVFMPHDENSIRYGLYAIDDNQGDRYFNILVEEISKCMLGAFIDEIIDDEMIITFTFYLLFTCYKKVYPTTPHMRKMWMEYYFSPTANTKVTATEQDIIQVKCKEIAPLINGIYKDVMTSNISEELTWLKNWENALVQVESQILQEKNHQWLLITQINRIICQNLGLTDFSYHLICVSVSNVFRDEGPDYSQVAISDTSHDNN